VEKLDGSDNRSQEYIPITDFFNTHALVSTIEAAARSYDLFAFASCERAKERDTTKTDLLFLPWKLADHFAATIKELQD
jgi:hypothetical protein